MKKLSGDDTNWHIYDAYSEIWCNNIPTCKCGGPWENNRCIYENTLFGAFWSLRQASNGFTGELKKLFNELGTTLKRIPSSILKKVKGIFNRKDE